MLVMFCFVYSICWVFCWFMGAKIGNFWEAILRMLVKSLVERFYQEKELSKLPLFT